jgi:uncharacterized protein (TIGR02271 family)
MALPETVHVTGPGSLRGIIDTTAWPLNSCRVQVFVQLDDGTSLLVPRDALVQQEDGNYHLILHSAMLDRRDAGGEVRESPFVIPVLQEVLDVHTRQVETGCVRICKSVHAHEEVVDPPLWRDEVVIERVPINRVVEGPMSMRSEDDTLITSMLEEGLVIEKRLLLTE